MDWNKGKDCGFSRDGGWFRYRAGAIIIEDDCVLMVRNGRDHYYYSVGGGVQLGETAQRAVEREVLEETGVHYEVDRLAVVHENFFNDSDGLLAGLDCHEIAFFFLMKPRGIKEFDNNSYTHGVKEEMCWLPIAELHKHKVFPTFLQEYLQNPQDELVHIVTDERRL